MGGGAAKEANKEARLAREAEEKRQAEIRAGTQRINSIFDGGVTATNPLAAGSIFDPATPYYLEDGTAWTPTAPATVAATPQNTRPAATKFAAGDTGGAVQKSSPGSTKFVAGVTAPQTANDEFNELLKAGKLYGGTTKQGGFGEDFFNGRRDAFMNYATPQLEDQYGNAQKDLTFSLARSGQLDSSSRASQFGELTKMYDLNKQQVASQALDYSNQARTQIEDARADLIRTLNATGDATGAATSAITRASALSQQPAFSPIGSLFSDFTSALGTQAAQERAAAASGGAYKSRYNTGLFGKSGSVQVS